MIQRRIAQRAKVWWNGVHPYLVRVRIMLGEQVSINVLGPSHPILLAQKHCSTDDLGLQQQSGKTGKRAVVNCMAGTRTDND